MPRTKKLKTKEDVNKYVADHYGTMAAVPMDVCGTWNKAKPVLDYIFAFGLVPSRWRLVYTSLAAVMDAFCAVPPA